LSINEIKVSWPITDIFLREELEKVTDDLNELRSMKEES